MYICKFYIGSFIFKYQCVKNPLFKSSQLYLSTVHKTLYI